LLIILVHHLLHINQLQQQLKRFSIEERQLTNQIPCLPLNVYKDCEPSSLVQCCAALEPLKKAAYRLQNEFPENVQLLQLLTSLDKLVNAKAGVPMMKHAAQLERILGMF
jgi:hypothetical protein